MNTEKTFTRSTSGDNAVAAAPRIEIYFKSWCPYSRWALELLTDKGVPFTTIDVTNDRVLEAEMIDRSGRTSVPQVFRRLREFRPAAWGRRGGAAGGLNQIAKNRSQHLVIKRKML